MSKHILLSAIFFALLLAATPDSFSQVSEDSLSRKPNRLLILPSHLFDPINPAMQLGFEKGFGQHHAIQIQGGIMLNQDLLSAFVSILPQDSVMVIYPQRGHKLRLEYRYYLDPLGEQVHPYLAVDFQYQRSSHTVSQDFWVSDTLFEYGFPVGQESGYIYEDEYRILKTKFGMNGKIGVLVVISPFITIDCFGGLGMFFKSIEQEERLNPADFPAGQGLFDSGLPGIYYSPNLPVGFSVGFQF